MKGYQKTHELQIKKVEITEDTLTGRGGLALLLRYITKIGFIGLIGNTLGHLRESAKGARIEELVRQLMAFFADGTYTAISGLDELRGSSSYAVLLETRQEELAGSDMIKRFFRKFFGFRLTLLRCILQRLFVWRLKIAKPKVIKLFLDTMVLDNDNAKEREGVEPTYKKKKGFQPLHLVWNHFIIDVMFRSGDKHSNHSDDVQKMLRTIVEVIRTEYDAAVPIIVRCDSGFLSEENFSYMERELQIGYIGAGKLYDSVTERAYTIPGEEWKTFETTHTSWRYTEFGSRLKSWERFRRTIFSSEVEEESHQMRLPFTGKDTVVYTNLGMNRELDEALIDRGYGYFLQADSIIRDYHGNGKDELVHRSIKEFMTRESLPFKRFRMNGAYYLMMVIAHFLFEAYKQDVGKEVIGIGAYPDTVRRRLIDFAAKIVRTAREVILKITRDTAELLDIENLWNRANNPIPI